MGHLDRYPQQVGKHAEHLISGVYCRHPHIVAFIDADVDDKGRLLMVMENMSFDTLSSAIGKGLVSWSKR